MHYESWGRFPKSNPEAVHEVLWTFSPLPESSTELLPFGQGRSYGDSCLNNEKTLLSTRFLNRLIFFDSKKGILRCEAGCTLADILQFTVPHKWFVPVTPGTKYVSVGGAVANDVHGKNHHCSGTFGRYVLAFEILLSDNSRKECSREKNPELFAATIGGLGLTGFITWVEFQLKPIANSYISQEVLRFRSIEEFFQISEDSEKDFEYTVAWVDCLAKGKDLGRGLFYRGNHAKEDPTLVEIPKSGLKLQVPIDAPTWLLNPISIFLFNQLYYRKQLEDITCGVVHYDPFFYPLDSILHWNRIYGKRGFLQYQCVVPLPEGKITMKKIMQEIAEAKAGSFLAVLKIFGDQESPGMLSFPRPGVTLTLDFPFDGGRVFTLLNRLDGIVLQAGGALYPAKDARMDKTMFAASFPRIYEFKKWIDPKFSSTFWRRVTDR